MTTTTENDNDDWLKQTIDEIQDIVGEDVGNRGMKHLIVPQDLYLASRHLANILAGDDETNIIILSGFPCCMQYDIPTETDGPPGAFVLARLCARVTTTLAKQHCNITLVTDQCNEIVWKSAMNHLDWMNVKNENYTINLLICHPNDKEKEEEKLYNLYNTASVIIACERAGPGKDGKCFTMRGLDMEGFVAPQIHSTLLRVQQQQQQKAPRLIAIGDGGNELGMGKVLSLIHQHVNKGEMIGCTVAADYLIAASVSNWGAYALVGAVSLVCAHDEFVLLKEDKKEEQQWTDIVTKWLDASLPTREEETAFLEAIVASGCRDGVSGRQEATVDGLPLETSLNCLTSIRNKCLGKINK